MFGSRGRDRYRYEMAAGRLRPEWWDDHSGDAKRASYRQSMSRNEALDFIHAMLSKLSSDKSAMGVNATQALEVLYAMNTSETHLRREMVDMRHMRDRCRLLADQLADGPTVVRVPEWSAEIEAWCDHSTPNEWKCVKDGNSSGAYFMFHDTKAAALFKLHWG
jgi:hypothetical protein